MLFAVLTSIAIAGAVASSQAVDPRDNAPSWCWTMEREVATAQLYNYTHGQIISTLANGTNTTTNYYTLTMSWDSDPGPLYNATCVYITGQNGSNCTFTGEPPPNLTYDLSFDISDPSIYLNIQWLCDDPTYPGLRAYEGANTDEFQDGQSVDGDQFAVMIARAVDLPRTSCTAKTLNATDPPHWDVSQVLYTSSNRSSCVPGGSCVTAYLWVQMSLLVTNSANGYEMSCLINTYSPDQYLYDGTEGTGPGLLPAGYEFPMADIQWFSCEPSDGNSWPTTASASMAFVKSLNAIAFNQTWVCDDGDGNQTITYAASGFGQIPLTCDNEDALETIIRRAVKPDHTIGCIDSTAAVPPMWPVPMNVVKPHAINQTTGG